MIIVSITEAKKSLEELIDKVLTGNRVVITKFGKPVVELVKTKIKSS